MNQIQFWILNLTSAALALLISFEIYSDHELDDVRSTKQGIETAIVSLQQTRPLAQQLLQQAVIASSSDPAIHEKMESYGFHITIKPRTASAPLAPAATTVVPASTNAAPVNPPTP